MIICVLNGSPAGNYSITLQTVKYIEKRFPGNEMIYLNVGTRIRAWEKDFSEPASALIKAELIVFAYPVYTFLAPSQLHRFIVLMKASGIDFSGKFATQLTTSKHFYDISAHRYIEDNCHDMGMKVIHGLSADMDDLLSKRGQCDADNFFAYVSHCAEHGIYEFPPKAVYHTIQEYIPVFEGGIGSDKSDKFDTVIVADLRDGDTLLAAMIEDFRHGFVYKTRLVNIAEYKFDGGCLGCFNCAADGKCLYKDGFDSFLREEIQNADAIVLAFTIRDHSMGEVFKTYDDRQFCNGHRTVTAGKPFGYIVNGDYEAEHNLRTLIEARCDVGHNFLAGVAYSHESMSMMVPMLKYVLENRYTQPQRFYGVGGMKIFRDLIWVMRGLMKADHKYYKAHGIYDFPQKKRFMMLKMCLLGALVRNPKVRAKMGNRMNEGMTAPYRKIVEEAHPRIKG